jgi:ammonia channel protein AmtB
MGRPRRRHLRHRCAGRPRRRRIRIAARRHALAGAAIVYGALKATVGLRLDEEDEFIGADLAIHRIPATPNE